MLAEGHKWHFGVLPFTGTGHLKPFILLSQELRDRGHKVTFFEKPKIEDRVRQAGLDFVPIGAEVSSLKRNAPTAIHTSLLSDISTLQFNLKRITRDLEIYLRDTPPALTRTGVDVLLINEIALTGPTLAQLLRLPYFIISTSVPHNFGWTAYPPFAGYRHSTSLISGLQRALLELSALRVRGPIRRVLDKYRRHLDLEPVREIVECYPALAQISQLPHCLDFRRTSFPDNFHYTGPFAKEAAGPEIDFPWDQLDGRSIIYASLGTTRNVQPAIFRLIAEGCKDLGHQLVISLGGRFDPEMFADLPGNPVVTRYAPQIDLLKLAKIVITHGGFNTVFETLLEGKPMVAIPLAHDQPAVAARLARLGIAEVLPVMRLSANRIRTAVTTLLYDPSYRDAALKIQTTLQSLHGLDRAAAVIEGALEKHLSSPRDLSGTQVVIPNTRALGSSAST
jgi:zeaxanthin glucosyltransferase